MKQQELCKIKWQWIALKSPVSGTCRSWSQPRAEGQSLRERPAQHGVGARGEDPGAGGTVQPVPFLPDAAPGTGGTAPAPLLPGARPGLRTSRTLQTTALPQQGRAGGHHRKPLRQSVPGRAASMALALAATTCPASLRPSSRSLDSLGSERILPAPAPTGRGAACDALHPQAPLAMLPLSGRHRGAPGAAGGGGSPGIRSGKSSSPPVPADAASDPVPSWALAEAAKAQRGSAWAASS